MKQKRSLALLLAMALCAGTFSFVACGETAHTEHTPSEWKSDNVNHWKVCTECNAELEKAAHSFKDGVCSVCGKKDESGSTNPGKDDPDPGEEQLPPVPYDPATDKESPGLEFVEITDEDGAIQGYRVKPGANFDRTVEELFLPQRHNNLPVLCVGFDDESYTELSQSGKSEAELEEAYLENGFYKCTSLKTVHFGAETTEIGPYSFAFCEGLEQIEFPDRIRTIGSGAFGACYFLSEINLPEELRTVGYYAFAACQRVRKITFNTKLKTIDDGAFSNMDWLEEAIFNKNLETIGSEAFMGSYSLKTIKFNDNLQSIGDRAFLQSGRDVEGVQTIDFGNSVSELGESTFFGCGTLESLEIPDCVTKIGTLCFSECIVQEQDEDGNYYYSSGLKHVKVGRGLQTIPEKAFGNNMILESVELTGTEIIGTYAFFACVKLKSFNFGDSLIKIETSAFWSDTSLEEIAFPDTLVEIGQGSFSMCSALKKVTLGKNLSVIGQNAFERCYAIVDVIYNGTPEDWKYVQNDGGLKSPTQYLG